MSYFNDFSESDAVVDQLLRECDEAFMPLPDIEYEPHILISKVRKHYMDYLIKHLSLNYETNQRLANKNIYLPSAIWRCAKIIETKAAQMCMVVQIYRKHIVSAIKEVKVDTKKGKLNKKLYECLHRPPENDKITQTSPGSSACICNCHKTMRQKTSPESTQKNCTETVTNNAALLNNNIQSMNTNQADTSNNPQKPPDIGDSDELTLQLEKLFQNQSNDDDLFDGSLYETIDSTIRDDTKKIQYENVESTEPCVDKQLITNIDLSQNTLDDRLATLLSQNKTTENIADTTQYKIEPGPPSKKVSSSKWLCEEYYLKTRYFELLDQIGDTNRRKLYRIKDLLLELFGEDSDDEGMVSPLEETPDFIISCKERIAPWVVKLLTPHYIKGRIRGKNLFKGLAKHLIRLIYQCSRYPTEYEVNSFVSDFLKNHKMIRTEADYKQFKIDNI